MSVAICSLLKLNVFAHFALARLPRVPVLGHGTCMGEVNIVIKEAWLSSQIYGKKTLC